MEKSTIKMFTGTRQIGDLRYCVSIPATDFNEAQELGARIGVVIDGQLIEEQAIGLCSKCAGPIVLANYENVQPETEEQWPDELEEEE